MIRTGTEYIESISDGRRVFLDDEVVANPVSHPAFEPYLAMRIQLYDMHHDPAIQHILAYSEGGEWNKISTRLPHTQGDWWDKRRARDTIFDRLGGMLSWTGDEPAGEIWSLFDTQDLLNDIDPQYGESLRNHIARVLNEDICHVSATFDPFARPSWTSGWRSENVQLKVVRETDAGLILRGAHIESGAACANQAFVILSPASDNLSDQTLGFICDFSSPSLRFYCRSPQGIGPGEDPDLKQFSCDALDTLVVFDDVLVPWENVLFYRSKEAARIVLEALRRYTTFSLLQHDLRWADMTIGAVLLHLRRSRDQAPSFVQQRLASIAAYRESINAHLTAAISPCERSPGGLMMPSQSLLHSGRMLAGSKMPELMQMLREFHFAREFSTPIEFADPEQIEACGEGRETLYELGRELLNSSYSNQSRAISDQVPATELGAPSAFERSFDWDATLRIAATMTARRSTDPRVSAVPADLQPRPTLGNAAE